MKKNDRGSWVYQGKRTYGVVTAVLGERATIKSPTGGSITRVGSKDDPVIRIRSESTGNLVLKRESQLRKASKSR